VGGGNPKHLNVLIALDLVPPESTWIDKTYAMGVDAYITIPTSSIKRRSRKDFSTKRGNFGSARVCGAHFYRGGPFASGDWT
jgi:hypothetical protein